MLERTIEYNFDIKWMELHLRLNCACALTLQFKKAICNKVKITRKLLNYRPFQTLWINKSMKYKRVLQIIFKIVETFWLGVLCVTAFWIAPMFRWVSLTCIVLHFFEPNYLPLKTSVLNVLWRVELFNGSISQLVSIFILLIFRLCTYFDLTF